MKKLFSLLVLTVLIGGLSLNAQETDRAMEDGQVSYTKKEVSKAEAAPDIKMIKADPAYDADKAANDGMVKESSAPSVKSTDNTSKKSCSGHAASYKGSKKSCSYASKKSCSKGSKKDCGPNCTKACCSKDDAAKKSCPHSQKYSDDGASVTPDEKMKDSDR